MQIRRLKSYLWVLTDIWVHDDLTSLGHRSVLLLCQDGDRGVEYFGKRYSHLIDSVGDKLSAHNLTSISISIPSARRNLKNYGTVVNVNGIISRAKIKDFVLSSLFLTRDKSVRHQVLAWHFLIALVRPKVIIAIQPPVELCIAAKMHKIPICDLQHGIFSEVGYYGLDFRKQSGQIGWPDYILCWDQRGADKIIRTARDFTLTRVIGNPWFERFGKARGCDPVVSYFEKQFNSNLKLDGRLRILFTLQFSLIEEYVDLFDMHISGLPKVLVEFIKGRGKRFDWWLKVHPASVRNPAAASAIFKVLNMTFTDSSNVFWSHLANAPLPLVLSAADLHMTYESATTIEAGWLGVKTALFGKEHDNLVDWFEPELRSGMAEILDHSLTLVESWIELNASGDLTSEKRLEGSNLLDGFLGEIFLENKI